MQITKDARSHKNRSGGGGPGGSGKAEAEASRVTAGLALETVPLSASGLILLSGNLKFTKISPFIPLDVSPHHQRRGGVKFITSVMALKRAISPDTPTIYGLTLTPTITFPRRVFPEAPTGPAPQ